jgi:hypothetical protein
MMITSMPWLKMAPNCGGQWRMQVSQLMQIDMSIHRGGKDHFGLRSWAVKRSGLVPADTGARLLPGPVDYRAGPTRTDPVGH